LKDVHTGSFILYGEGKKTNTFAVWQDYSWIVYTNSYDSSTRRYSVDSLHYVGNDDSVALDRFVCIVGDEGQCKGAHSGSGNQKVYYGISERGFGSTGSIPVNRGSKYVVMDIFSGNPKIDDEGDEVILMNFFENAKKKLSNRVAHLDYSGIGESVEIGEEVYDASVSFLPGVNEPTENYYDRFSLNEENGLHLINFDGEYIDYYLKKVGYVYILYEDEIFDDKFGSYRPGTGGWEWEDPSIPRQINSGDNMLYGWLNNPEGDLAELFGVEEGEGGEGLPLLVFQVGGKNKFGLLPKGLAFDKRDFGAYFDTKYNLRKPGFHFLTYSEGKNSWVFHDNDFDYRMEWETFEEFSKQRKIYEFLRRHC